MSSVPRWIKLCIYYIEKGDCSWIEMRKKLSERINKTKSRKTVNNGWDPECFCFENWVGLDILKDP